MTPREALGVARGLPVAQRETSGVVEGLPVAQRKTSGVVEGLPVTPREALGVARGLPVAPRETSNVVRGSPVTPRETHGVVEGLPVRRRASLDVVEGLPVRLSLEPGRLRLLTMSTSTKPLRRPIAALNLPEYDVPRFMICARAIVSAMTGNASFPAPRPPLATVAASIDDLSGAETVVRTKVTGAVAVRDGKRAVLLMQLQQLRAYVQSVADGDPENAVSIIESAGMSVKKVGVPPPRVFVAKAGLVSGEVVLVAPKAAGRGPSYEWAYSLDGGKSWLGQSVTVKATLTVTGLKPGATVIFRYRAVTNKGTGDWVDPVAFIVG